MAVIASVSGGPSALNLPPPPQRLSKSSDRRHLNFSLPVSRTGHFYRSAKLRFSHRIKNFQQDAADNIEVQNSEVNAGEDQNRDSDNAIRHIENKTTSNRSSFLPKLGILLGIAAVITLVSVSVKPPNQETVLGIQHLKDGVSSTAFTAPSGAFSFKAFGYRVVLPEYPPGWVYFWLLMAAGCGLFISEEALNIWVGISLARLLSLDGTWHSLFDSFSRNAPYIMSTVVWVYWGVCISDMVPFYLGRFFRQSGASDNIYSKLGVGKEKAMHITSIVQKFGNLIGFVERFSLGVRNPTAFLAGAMDISPECFFAGVCCGGLITLPLQMGIGFLLRERPVFALATVATVVGMWTIFPYAIAALTALFLYIRRRYFSS